MRFGLCIPHYGRAVSVDELRTTVELAEALGFHSLWISDHVITPDHLLPTIGPTWYDAFVVLTYAAAFTKKIRLGTTVIVVPYRNPLVVAKMVATLDVLSEGRVILGVGTGGAPDEFRALGVPSHQRGRRTDEYLRLMVALWTQDPTNFRGRFFSFTDVRFEPKPIQAPHPPICVGGRSDAALRRAVVFGEAWHPMSMPMPALKENMSRLRCLADEAGRPDGPTVTVHQHVRLAREDGPARVEDRRLGWGTAQQLCEDVQQYQDLAVPVIVCNFGATDLQELWGTMETFSVHVMAHFPEAS